MKTVSISVDEIQLKMILDSLYEKRGHVSKDNFADFCEFVNRLDSELQVLKSYKDN